MKLSDKIFFKKQFLIVYKVFVVILFIFSSFIIFFDYHINKDNFDKAYWSIDNNTKEKEYGTCRGEWGFFKIPN